MRYVVLLLALLVQAMPATAITGPGDGLRNGMSWYDYHRQPVISGAELSPSGQRMSAVRNDVLDVYVMVLDLDNKEDRPTYIPFDRSIFINWIEWANEDWLIVSVTAYSTIKGDTLTRRALETYSYDDFDEIPFPVTRLLLVNRDGSQMTRVFEGDRALENRNLNLGRVVSFLPDDPDHFLIAARLRGDLDLFRINVATGGHERVGVGRSRTIAWYVDTNGEPAFRVDTNRRGTRLTYYGREDRKNGEIKWRRLRSVRVDEPTQTMKQSTEFRPISPGPDPETYYVAARPQGVETTGIYLYNFATDSFVKTIKTNPKIDIENAIVNPETYEFLGSWHYEDRLRIEYVDQDLQAHIDGLEAFFAGEANLVPQDSNRDGTRWLLFASGPTEPGTYYIYSPETANIEALGSTYPDLRRSRLSEMEILRYTARDGTEITGYLTVPTGTPEGVIPPLVVMPHGGPEMRDVYEYNVMVQTLAAHGYAVFQPNFRGSSGYGLRFADAGRRQWGKAMQTDVEDGFRHLVSTGRARAGNACIVGYSYGGYSALAAATLTPDLYNCAIAGSGPSDLVEMLKWVRKEDGRDSEEYEYWRKHIGDPSDDRTELRAVSPAELALYATRPILLIHGTHDSIVPIEQSEIMEKALKKAGKPVEFVRLGWSGHTYRGGQDDWKEMKAILNFLEQHLEVDPAIWAYGQ